MKYHLFEVIGVELEYMIVQDHDLRIVPIADQVFFRHSGSWDGEADRGLVSWSNELVAHVIELKTTNPVEGLAGLSAEFHRSVSEINRMLAEENCALLPTASHPFMDPLAETQLWPHDSHEIYNLYDRVFDCRGHGWGNVQSTHINLPFCGDEEFARLHAAIRLILPVLPGLCASSPILEGSITGFLDTRMHYYQYNQAAIPHITGKVIPERIYDEDQYQKRIFDPINASLRTYDTDGILDHHFVNSRGAIARFDRGSIEIRVMDIQESPMADLGIVGFLLTVIKALVLEGDFSRQSLVHEDDLFAIFQDCIKDGEHALVVDQNYLEIFGMGHRTGLSVRDFWSVMYEKYRDRLGTEEQVVIEHILHHGSLATRILRKMGDDYSRNRIVEVYQSLRTSLATNQMF